MTFTRSATAQLAERGGEVHFWTHPTGLRHIHLADPTVPPTFYLTVPTLVDRDDGVAHVLEHMVMFGSERYPVRNLFSRMDERTLASFMNAMTSRTHTAYPFVSPHRDDFLTLLPVYLDLVFHPLLRAWDFRQEGVRQVVAADGTVTFQGVVFNEMKGVFEDPFHHIYHGLFKALHPTDGFGQESGGDPLVIPALTHERLVAFHRDHYHPGRAVVFSAGDPRLVADIQAALEQTLAGTWPAVAPLTLPRSPLQGKVSQRLAVPSPTGTHAVIVAYRLGSGLTGEVVQPADILGNALVAQSGSPWQRALQNANLGRPGAFTGTLPIGEEQWLLAHVEGLADDAEVAQVHALLTQVVAEVADGRAELPVSTALHQFESQQRMRLDTGAQGAVSRFEGASEAALFLPDPLQAVVDALDPLASLPRWADQVSDGALRARAAALAQADQLILHLAPDTHFQAAREQAEQALQAHAQARLAQDPTLRAQLQAQEDEVAPDEGPVEALPVTDIALIPATIQALPTVIQATPGVAHIEVPLSGVGSLTLMAQLGQMNDDQACNAKLVVEHLLTEMGMGEADWEQATARREAVAIRLDAQVNSLTDQAGQCHIAAMVSARGLTGQAIELGDVLFETLTQTRWDDDERVSYLVSNAYEGLVEALPAHAHDWVELRMGASFTALGAWRERSEGLPAVAHLQAWHARCQAHPDEAIHALAHVHAHLVGALTWTVVPVGDAHWQRAADHLRSRLVANGMRVGVLGPEEGARSGHPAEPMGVALVAPTTQSRHLQAGWVAPRDDHADAPRLMALAKVLEQTTLWERLRTQGGAYGGHAAYEQRSFVMSSYRDPRLEGTFADFEQVREQALSAVPASALAHAVRGIFQSTDRPLTAWQQAQRAMLATWQGRTDVQRQAFRTGLLTLTPDTVAQAAQRWLHSPAVHLVAYVPAVEAARAQALGLVLEPLP